MKGKAWKKGLGVALVASLVFAGGVWASPAITLIVNGQRSAAEVRIINGVTFLPLRAVATLLGVPVHWDGRTRTITVGTASTAPTPAPAPARPASGTLQNPIPVGTTAAVGPNWNVTVLEIIPNAWDIIRAENQFNDPPAPGRQFIMARVGVSYVGPGSGTPWVALTIRFVGSDGNTYGGAMADYTGVIPRPLTDIGEQFSGAVAEGNVAWSVPMPAIPGGVISISEGWRPETRVFFAGAR